MGTLGTPGGGRRAHVENITSTSQAAGRLDLAERPKGWQLRADRFLHARHFGAGRIEEVYPEGVGRNQAWLCNLVVAPGWKNMQHVGSSVLLLVGGMSTADRIRN